MCAAACAAPPSTLVADDSAALVEALRDRGHFDLALDYLDRAADDPLATPEFRKRIGYQRAVTRLLQARSINSTSERAGAIEAARRSLEEFIQNASDPALSAEARVRLAGVMVDDARARLASARAQGEEALAGVRRAFDEARSYYSTAEEDFEAAIDALGAVEPGSPAAQERLELRFNLAQARLLAAQALMEKAESYRDEAPQRTSTLEAAAEDFAGLYDKYGNSPRSVGVGLYAHLYEGECYLKLGKTRLADGCFEVLVNLPADQSDFRRLITLAHARLAASRIDQQKYARALEDGQAWLDELAARESRSPDVLALKYQVGEAARLLAASGEREADARRLLGQARSLLGDAARSANERQADARRKLVEVNNQLGVGDGDGGGDAESFDEAFRMGMDAINAMRAAQLALEVAGDDQPPDDQTQQQVDANRTRAAEALARALALADAETPRDRLNEARYWLGYLYWQQQDYLRAAALAEFIATTSPQDPSAELAAKLAMDSLWRLYAQAKEDPDADASFETGELTRLSQLVTRRWSGTDTADAAFSVLLATAIREDRLDEARQALQNVPAERRGPLALRLASAEWEQATREAAAARSAEERQRAARKKEDAAASLESAVSDQRGGERVSSTLATAALYLAQARLDGGNAAGALELLEDDQLGPLTLVERDAPAVNRPGYAAEAYRTALRAYVTAAPPRTEDALAMMQRLEETVSDRAALTKVYFGLAAQLQRQVQSLTAAGKTEQAAQVSEAFAEFLSRVEDAGEEADWTTRQWMAQTFLTLGDGVADGDAQRRFYERARDGFASMISAAKEDPALPPSATSVLAARLQLGQAQRRLGEYDAALDTFAAILRERETMIQVQKAAAYTYQDWGEAEGAEHFTSAIRGGRPHGQTDENLVWGWSKLASVAARAARTQPKYRDLYFESWLNVATCRYLAGMKADGAERSEQLQRARKTIRVMAQQYSDLGGAERRRDFDTLLKKIQRAEGAEPVGLAEFDREAS